MNKKLKTAVNEKDVENIYRAELLKLVPKSTITSPHQIDGLFEHGSLRMLLEFKYIDKLKIKLSQCNVLVQSLYYLKKFEDSGEKLPNVIFVGDINECMAVHTNAVVKYLAHEINWKLAPSEAHKNNPTLLQAMVNDVDILPFVYDVDEKFHLKEILEQLKDLSENVVRKIRITEHNISSIFDYFDKNVLSEKCKLNTNEKANLFMQLLINPAENYLHTKKKNTLVTKSFGETHVNQNLFGSFFAHFEGEVYSPKEKEKLTGFVDRLVEDTTRRRQGFFSTPTAFVDLAHKYISNTFGEDWKERFVVFDSCCGVGQLTRDYKFKELYLSTLEQSELDTISQMGYNPEATKFQFDFLNDDDSKLPQGLQDAINSGKEILFLINPPYAKATPNKGEDGTGISDTIIGEEMRINKLGISSSQLSTQFLYRILQLKKTNPNINVCIFNKPNYMTSDGFKIFRNMFLNKFGFKNGFLFNASHFSDTANTWGISFTLWSSNTNNIKNSFKHKIVDMNPIFEIDDIDDKHLYNCDSSIKANVIFDVKIKNDTYQPSIKSFITIDVSKDKMGTQNAIGYINNDSNNLMQQNAVFLASSVISANGNKAITLNNFDKVNALFTARKAVQQNWINDKDEYLAPNENHPDWQQFVNDSLVYSLFNNSSQQSSLRQIIYKDKLWDIKNEFFWLSKEQMMDLGEKHNYDELYKDAKNGENRFVYEKLFGQERIYDTLSPQAKEVLDTATDLLIKSIPLRKLMSEQHPEYHLNSFDSGYAQKKIVLKEYFKDEFRSFREKYSELEKFKILL